MIYLINSVLQPNQSLCPMKNFIIILIPKKKHNANHPKYFRPISLINGLQQILFKIMFNRIQYVILSLISSNQTNFLHGRLITRNFLYAQQLLCKANKNNNKLAIFKSDIHNSYRF
jgi:Reverse transcriptase (RNA-dependent DNA polymerase)